MDKGQTTNEHMKAMQAVHDLERALVEASAKEHVKAMQEVHDLESALVEASAKELYWQRLRRKAVASIFFRVSTDKKVSIKLKENIYSEMRGAPDRRSRFAPELAGSIRLGGRPGLPGPLPISQKILQQL